MTGHIQTVSRFSQTRVFVRDISSFRKRNRIRGRTSRRRSFIVHRSLSISLGGVLVNCLGGSSTTTFAIAVLPFSAAAIVRLCARVRARVFHVSHRSGLLRLLIGHTRRRARGSRVVQDAAVRGGHVPQQPSSNPQAVGALPPFPAQSGITRVMGARVWPCAPGERRAAIQHQDGAHLLPALSRRVL